MKKNLNLLKVCFIIFILVGSILFLNEEVNADKNNSNNCYDYSLQNSNGDGNIFLSNIYKDDVGKTHVTITYKRISSKSITIEAGSTNCAEAIRYVKKNIKLFVKNNKNSKNNRGRSTNKKDEYNSIVIEDSNPIIYPIIGKDCYNTITNTNECCVDNENNRKLTGQLCKCVDEKWIIILFPEGISAEKTCPEGGVLPSTMEDEKKQTTSLSASVLQAYCEKNCIANPNFADNMDGGSGTKAFLIFIKGKEILPMVNAECGYLSDEKENSSYEIGYLIGKMLSGKMK